ncbi:MAG: hypothetical protein NT118_05240 [Lentisphaerae bacterium]|nr:hypothetical protein [Lentisphaerota bacterium]
MQKLYFHIGTHKTGTTTIQQCMYEHRTELESEKIVLLNQFPEIVGIRYLDSPDAGMVKRSREYLLKTTKGFSPEHRFVMSSEGFSGNLFKGYYNSERIAEFLSKVSAGFDVRIIVYLRRQDFFIESLYTQMIHQGESYSFSDFALNYDASSFDWHSLVSNFSKYFGKDKMSVRLYDKEVLPRSDSLVKDFAAQINSSVLRDLEVKKNHNIGYGRVSLEVARLCNPYLSIEQRKALRRILQSSTTKVPFESSGFFSVDEREQFMSRYEESNSRVAEDYFGGRGRLFNSSSGDHEKFKGLTAEDVARTLALALVAPSEKDKLLSMKSIQALYKIEAYIEKNKFLKACFKLPFSLFR